MLLPLAIHGVWGIGRLATSRPNNVRYGYYANLKYLLQRLSAIGVLLFLGAHMWRALLHPRLVEGRAEAFADIAQEIHFNTPTLDRLRARDARRLVPPGERSPDVLHGLGHRHEPAGLRRLEGAALALFVLLLAMSWAAVYALWAAGASPA